MFYKVSIPFDAAEEIQDFHTSFYQFLNNYGSTAWSRVVETEVEGEDEYQITLEIVSQDRSEIEKIDVGVMRGMERFLDENTEYEWTWVIEELHTLE